MLLFLRWVFKLWKSSFWFKMLQLVAFMIYEQKRMKNALELILFAALEEIPYSFGIWLKTLQFRVLINLLYDTTKNTLTLNLWCVYDFLTSMVNYGNWMELKSAKFSFNENNYGETPSHFLYNFVFHRLWCAFGCCFSLCLVRFHFCYKFFVRQRKMNFNVSPSERFFFHSCRYFLSFSSPIKGRW